MKSYLLFLFFIFSLSVRAHTERVYFENGRVEFRSKDKQATLYLDIINGNNHPVTIHFGEGEDYKDIKMFIKNGEEFSSQNKIYLYPFQIFSFYKGSSYIELSTEKEKNSKLTAKVYVSDDPVPVSVDLLIR